MNTERAAQDQGHAVQWIDATEAARRLGISPRAVQKRCAAGKMAARRITTPQGVRWELDARELGREPTNQQDANSSHDSLERGSFDAQNDANRDANPRTTGREPTNELRELLAREREINAFLKSQIEEGNRNAQELRATLREALKATPRQLTQGGAIDAPGRPDERRAHPTASPMMNGRQWEAELEGDEMSADELLDLCRRISR